MKKVKSAFTLIELLVVIAIIAILAAILFPVFAQAKLAAKKTTALSNAKQVALANFIYMGDYDDALIKEFFGFPSDCASWPSLASSYYGWRHPLYPYAKNRGLMADITNPYSNETWWKNDRWDSNDDGDFLDTAEEMPTNFAVNNDLIGFANGRCAGPWTPEGLNSLDQIEEPASTILFIPSRSKWNDLKPSFISTIEGKTIPDDWCNRTDPNNANSASCPAGEYGPIHAISKQAAFVWADGHAKTKNVLATLDVNNPNRDDWGSKYAINPRTGTYWTQADRIQVYNTAWGEYK
ncbi:MAG TPA: prepilin-type N-terminal cleavage/methylation domain-containing protein [Fimbriimonadaceae bacterium]|nr:prepilin-type N-terminal cleavage/methylation domain-containing protein [Fimbriimonadaceae bacterium]